MIRPPDVIHPDTTIGAVHLTVADLGRSIAFYEEKLGFLTRGREAGVARLDAGGADLLVLHESPSGPRARGATGLYHFALLVPSRFDLARSLARFVETGTPLQGLSDHLVSEAVYLADPDGNGIEIYRDRPREEWVFDSGSLRMASLPLDPASLLSETEGRGTDGERLSPGTMIGHVHLCVSDVAAAEGFYVDVLGFERTVRYGAGASFVSAGGYHHHIGFNTWTSAGAGPPPPGAIGLRYFVVRLPGEAESGTGSSSGSRPRVWSSRRRRTARSSAIHRATPCCCRGARGERRSRPPAGQAPARSAMRPNRSSICLRPVPIRKLGFRP